MRSVSIGLKELLDRPIAFHRAFVSLGVGVTGALFLSQAIYWANRTRDEDGWFYKSMEEWEGETGLTRSEQETARKRLTKIKVIQEVKKGVPCRLFYRVNVSAIYALLIDGTAQPSLQESRKQDRAKDAGKIAEHKQAITETTAETTAETTTDHDPAADAAAVVEVLEGELLGDERSAPREPMTIHAGDKRYEIPADMRYPGPDTKSHKTWINYAICYHLRYGAWPLWNATAAGMITQFIARVGADVAPKVAAFYVGLNDAYVLKVGHSVKALLANAEKYHTQYVTGRSMTDTRARQIDQSQSNYDAASEAMALLEQRRAEHARA